MEQTTLKYLRILIPGLIFYLGLFPIAECYLSSSYDIRSLDFAYVTVFSLLIGAMYDQFNFRYIVVRFSGYFIDKSIFDRLMGIYGSQICRPQKTYLKKDGKYMHVLYKLVDNDESLKKKANNIYFNGIFWTSSADLLLISPVFWYVYRWHFANINNSLLFSNLFLILAVLAIILHILSVLKHIRLSKNQLEFIEIYKKKEVIDDFDVILRQMPPANP
jgi:hypothetical protein